MGFVTGIAAFDGALGGAPMLGGGLGGGPPAQRDAAPDAMLPAGANGTHSAPGDASRSVEITPVEVSMALKFCVALNRPVTTSGLQSFRFEGENLQSDITMSCRWTLQ